MVHIRNSDGAETLTISVRDSFTAFESVAKRTTVGFWVSTLLRSSVYIGCISNVDSSVGDPCFLFGFKELTTRLSRLQHQQYLKLDVKWYS